MSCVRVRFPPSPTGYLHVGGARTALFNWLFARRHGGVFILRIEDTDRSRYQEGAVQAIYDGLRWLGLDWDEGPSKGGDYGPYVQSERTKMYRQASRELVERGAAYPCFCTSERLQKVREEQEKAKLSTTGYDRHCRELPAEEVERRIAAGEPYVIRLKVPLGRKVAFDDLIRGPIEYESDQLDDIVLLKRDGFPTYHLANVVDDHHMRISHVMRGAEWISSTPRHVLLYEAFGWQPPAFAHLPVILAPGGGKLSKRKGAASVTDFREGGFLPEALVNFLALVGWAPGDDRERMSVQELVDSFSLERVSPKEAVFDEKKLEWLNGQYLQDCPIERLAPQAVEEWRRLGFVGPEADVNDQRLRTIVSLMKGRVRRTTEIAPQSAYFFRDPEDYDPKGVKKHFKGDAAMVLQRLHETLHSIDDFEAAPLEELYRAKAEEWEMSVGTLIHSTRLAVSGVTFGPGLFELMECVGREAVVRRLQRAAQWLKSREDTAGG